jgi:hypothetical protein
MRLPPCASPILRPEKNSFDVGAVAGHSTRDASRRPDGRAIRFALSTRRDLQLEIEETKRMKPTDEAIFGMASKSPGRNASEPSGGLDKI